ncbi:MAG TPA: ATP-dependent Clp protease proteolytic subunit [Acidimicrobiales bacterium]|nr:ATP-dependent Clp protease proteolytic subunit [Acidimicrobiales bacterium]
MTDPGNMSEQLQAAMFDRRLIMLSGDVDPIRAGDVVAGLLTLDALGDEAIDLRVNGHSDSLDAAFSLMDTIDALGVPVRVVCNGTVSGTLVGILAVAEGRVIAPHGRVRLAEPSQSFGGRAEEVAARAAQEQERLELFQRRLAERTGHPLEHIEADMQAGRYLTAEEAVAYGLADAVSS